MWNPSYSVQKKRPWSYSRECWVPLRVVIVAMLVVGTTTGVSRGGEYNEVLSIGDSIPSWKALPGTDGKNHSLDDYRDKDFLVVVFTCASCPTAADYEDRIGDLVKKYGPEGPTAIIPVCVNTVAADRLPALTKRVMEKKLPFHYLHDETQKIAKDFGAIFTPEFYVFDRDRRLIYMGALDDSTDPEKVTRHYVEEAISASLKGEKPSTAETIARGCRVRYARERRK